MPVIDPTKDYYAILEIPLAATQEQIRDAHRDLARQYHPDTGHGDVERFHLVQEAYAALSDGITKRAYDRQRARHGVGPGPVTLDVLQSMEQMPWVTGEQLLYVYAEVAPHQGLRGPRKRMNIALVVDKSTSMNGARMHNVKLAASDLVDSLGNEDRLAVVTYSDRAEVVVPSQYARQKRQLRSAIASISASGGTEIYQGLIEGIDQVGRFLSDDAITHVILLTDGRTYGDEDLALAAAERASQRGIGVSAFGIGEDWNDLFLDNLARRGGGTSQYIDAPSKVQQVLRSQIRSLSNTVLRDVTVRLAASASASLRAAYRVLPHLEIMPVGADKVLKLGNVMAGETSAVCLDLVVTADEPGEHRLARLVVDAQSVASSEHVEVWQDINATFTQDVKEQVVPPRLMNVLARVSVFRLQENAWQAFESGDQRQATRYLECAATHLFDLGYRELGRAAMLEVTRLAHGNDPTTKGRKKLRYGTRSLSIPTTGPRR